MKSRMNGDALLAQFNETVDAERVLIRLSKRLRKLGNGGGSEKQSHSDFLLNSVQPRAQKPHRRQSVLNGLKLIGVNLEVAIDAGKLKGSLEEYLAALNRAIDEQSEPMRALPDKPIRELLKAIKRIEPNADLARSIQGGKRETVIRDQILAVLHAEAEGEDKEDLAQREAAIAGKQIDLVLNPNCSKSKLFVECKVAFAGALGTEENAATGLTGESSGLFGDILKTSRCLSLRPMCYLLIVPHFHGSQRAMEKVSQASCFTAAILAQKNQPDKDWKSAVRKRVKSELNRKFGTSFLILGKPPVVDVGTASGVNVELQFFLIGPK